MGMSYNITIQVNLSHIEYKNSKMPLHEKSLIRFVNRSSMNFGKALSSKENTHVCVCVQIFAYYPEILVSQ